MGEGIVHVEKAAQRPGSASASARKAAIIEPNQQADGTEQAAHLGQFGVLPA